MPATLTLKNIPDEIHALLKAAAKANRRSLNNEAIVRLETALMPQKSKAMEHLEMARELRGQFEGKTFDPDTINQFKRQGRT